jgi:peptidyl-prolyl cis-trans isomerase B (cyclophilin B)
MSAPRSLLLASLLSLPLSLAQAGPKVQLKTSMGDITLELNEEKAPATVKNFLSYVKEGFFDKTVFHRVIDGFMIQGGGFEPGMIQKETRDPIANEASNGLANNRGTVAMARTMDPHSATAQFFINVTDNDFLNFRSETPDGFGYCVFARVYDGMDVVDAIRAVDTTHRAGHSDVPRDDVIINKVSII